MPFPQMFRPCIAGFCAWWVGNNQIPFVYCGSAPPACYKFTVSIQEWQAISLNVPFRVSAAAFQQIAAIRFMPSGPECFANLLAFFTGDKYTHVLTPLLFPSVLPQSRPARRRCVPAFQAVRRACCFQGRADKAQRLATFPQVLSG